ncbi:MAG: ABC transporter permease [Planctomycetota bacterium]
MLPFSYAVRNLARSPARLVQLVVGSALVVLLILTAAAFQHGMSSSLQASGDPHTVMLLAAGSEESIQRSQVSPAVPGIVAASVPGLHADLGREAVSGEIYYMGTIFTGDGGEHRGLLRGVTPAALRVHRRVRLLDGHFPGPDEIMVGRHAATSLGVDPAQLATGARLRFEGHEYTVSGHFAAAGTVLEAELWLGQRDLMAVTKRESLSAVYARMQSPAQRSQLTLFCKQRLDLELSAVPETEYYSGLDAFFAPLRIMGWVSALLIGGGAIFGGINTLYAAFSARIRELAALQAIGFSRRAIAWSLVQEAMLATAFGGMLAMILAVLIIDPIRIGFSIGVFSLAMPPEVLGLGLLAALALGLFGGLPPAWRCLAPPLPSALRAA